jgi:hypothetical protein
MFYCHICYQLTQYSQRVYFLHITKKSENLWCYIIYGWGTIEEIVEQVQEFRKTLFSVSDIPVFSTWLDF